MDEVSDQAYPNLQQVRCRWVLYLRASGEVKARIVAQQINNGSYMEGAYASTPAQIAQGLVFLWAASAEAADDVVIVLGDVSTAFLHASLPSEHVVLLIPPTPQRQRGKLWYPKKAVYGLRVSPGLFQEYFAEAVIKDDWVRCQMDQQLFYHPSTKSVMSVHADDILVAAPRAKLEELKQKMGEKLKLKWGAPLDAEWVPYLGREWRRIPGGFATRMSRRTYNKLLRDAGLERCKPVKAPAVTMKLLRDDASENLEGAMLAAYRTATGRLLWMTPVRPDLAFLIKEASRRMQTPTLQAQQVVKTILRYIAGTQSAELRRVFGRGRSRADVVVWVDASWASEEGRRSTSGGLLFVGGFVLAHWARTQPVVATSSCEAELLSLTTGAQEGLLATSLLQELGVEATLTLRTDSTSAMNWLVKKGCGRLKHIEIRQMWLQDVIKQRKVKLEFTPSGENLADMLTKPLAGPLLRTLAEQVGMVFPTELEPNAVAVLEENRTQDEQDYQHEQMMFLMHVGLLLAGCWQLLMWGWLVCSRCVRLIRPAGEEALQQRPLQQLQPPESSGPVVQVTVQTGLLDALDLPGALPYRRRRAEREEAPHVPEATAPPAGDLPASSGDSGSAASGAVRPGQWTTYRCTCGLSLRAMMVKRDTPNKGRLFVTCPKSLADPTRCDYFRWI